MDIIDVAALGTFAVVIAMVIVTSVLNLTNFRRGLGPDRRAVRIQAMTLGLATCLFALLGIAQFVLLGRGLVAVLALPFVGIGLFLVQTAWKYR